MAERERPARLPPLPQVSFREDGTPVGEVFGDVYFSASDGLEETRAVYLAGCGLPDAFAGRESFTVAELGFGTGLNVLALWQMWRAHRPSPCARLDVVSFEGFPLSATQAALALSRWPELSEFAGALLAQWPARARGVQTLAFPADGVRLTLHIGDIAQTLPQARFLADAWFLDGFSPAKNPEMWSDDVLAEVARKTRPGGRAATFTVAGAVRRGLEAHGFALTRQPGFGRKRERLEARLERPAPLSNTPHDPIHPVEARPVPRRVAILGAGIAGACLARVFLDRGADVTVFDRASGPASGASGNPLALVHSRLDAADTTQARLHIAAGLAARAFYHGLPGVLPVPVTQWPRDVADDRRFAALAADPPLDGDLLTASGEALIHHGGLAIRPAEAIPALLRGASARFGVEGRVDAGALEVDGEAFDAVIIASAMDAARFGLDLAPKAGQVEAVAAALDPFALTRSNYALSDGQTLVFGATFAASAQPEADWRAENLAAFEALMPELARRFGGGSPLTSRVSVRATTPDRLPVARPLPDVATAASVLAPLRHGRDPDGPVPVHPGVFVVTGLGSRGFTLAPLMAELVAACACGQPLPVSAPEAMAVSPFRFLLRQMRRGGSQAGK